MYKALTSAATGLQAQQKNIENISSDLSNANTTAYKRSRNEFEDLMYETLKEPGGALGAGAQTPVGIQTGLGVKVGAAYKIFDQGPAQATGNEMDLAIMGEGFFPIQLPSGEIAYTRNGAFGNDAQGRMVTRSGALILPQINIPTEATRIMISPSGEVKAQFDNGQESVLGQLQLVRFINSAGLKAVGGSLYMPTLASGQPQQGVPGEDGFGALQSGSLEGSNVNVANSMVDMISSQRAYEMGTKVMKTVDNMMEATVNIK